MDVPDFLRNGRVLIAVFVLLAVVTSVATVFALGGAVDELLVAVGGGLVVALVVVGSYLLGVRYGQPHSHAVAQAGVLFGVVLTVAVVAELLLDSGRLSNSEITIGIGGSLVATIVLIGLVGALDRATA